MDGDMIKKLRILYIWAAICLLPIHINADETKSRPVTFASGSSLTINSGVTTNFLSGSITDFNAGSTVDFTGATVTGLAGGGGSSVWGGITGTLSDQTDLQTALNAKVNTTRTVNGHALSANVTVTSGDVGLGNVTNDIQTKQSIVPNDAPLDGEVLIGDSAAGAYIRQSISGISASISMDSGGRIAISGIDNASLVNSNITIAGTSTSLGGSIARDTITGVSANGLLRRTGANTLTNDASTYLTGNQTITLSGDVTGSGATAITTTIAGHVVTYAKLQSVNTNVVLGRATAASGDAEELTALPFGLTGDVTTAADSNATTIANDAVTYAKMQNVSATNRFLGRITAGAGDTEELTAANAKTILALTSSDVGLGSVTNDAQTKASVVPNTAATDGQMFVGKTGSAWQIISLSGSGATFSMSNAGVLTVSGIANASLTNSAITIAGTSTSLGGSITQDTITGLSSNGFVKRTGANTLAVAADNSSNTHLLFNDSGAVGGDADLTWDKTNNRLALSAGTGYIRLVTNAGSADGFVAAPFATTSFSNNAIYNSGWKYDQTNTAALLEVSGSNIKFQTAASGTAGTAITWNQQALFTQGGGVAFGTAVDPGTGYVNTPTGYKVGNAEYPVAANGLVKRTAANTYSAVAPGAAGYQPRSDGTTFASYPTIIVNSSTASQSATFAADTYLTGSNPTVTAGDFKAKGQYKCKFDMVKTAAGTAATVITLRIGTNGSTADTSRITWTFGAGTGVIDTGTYEITVNWRTVGSGTTAVVSGICNATHNLATTGLFNNAASWTIVGTVSGGFDSSTATTMGLSFNGGASFSGTTTTVQSLITQ